MSGWCTGTGCWYGALTGEIELVAHGRVVGRAGQFPGGNAVEAGFRVRPIWTRPPNRLCSAQPCSAVDIWPPLGCQRRFHHVQAVPRSWNEAFQATAQVFHARTPRRLVPLFMTPNRSFEREMPVGLNQAQVCHTVQGDGRLGHGGAGSSQHGQGDQGFFHCELPRLNIGRRYGVWGSLHLWQSRRFPGQPPGGGSCCYCTRRRQVSQRKSPTRRPKRGNSLSCCNTTVSACTIGRNAGRKPVTCRAVSVCCFVSRKRCFQKLGNFLPWTA